MLLKNQCPLHSFLGFALNVWGSYQHPSTGVLLTALSSFVGQAHFTAQPGDAVDLATPLLKAILSKPFLSYHHMSLVVWVTMYKATSSVMSSFIPVSWDLGSKEKKLTRLLSLENLTTGAVAGHQAIETIPDWIIQKVLPSGVEAVKQWICS